MGLPKGPGKGRAGGERQSGGLSRSEPSPAPAFTELYSPSKYRLFHLQVVIDAYMLFFPPFPMIHSQKVVSAAPGECFHLRALTEPWLGQLYLHSRGSLCHLVKRTEGIRVLACNSFHNTETHAFPYKLYPALYLHYFSPCISWFSDKKEGQIH